MVACDVDNPLTGPHGAAAVYGPQKGASPDDIARLDGALDRWADAVAVATGTDFRDAPGAGAAGGVGFAAIALLGARLRPGIDLVLDLVGFHRQLAGASLVITGEGSLDEQTLSGKAPAGVAAAAVAAGIPVVAVCGRSLLTEEQWRAAGISAVYSLSDIEPDPSRSMADAAPLLERLAGDDRGRSSEGENAMTERYDLVIHAPRAITPAGEVACHRRRPRRNHRRHRAISVPNWPADRVLRLAADEVLLPGLVDTHVHVNDPGRTEWEGFVSATRAAAAGGVTTIVDMPLNSLPPTVDVAALEVKRKAASGDCFVDVGFWGGAIPGNVADLRPLHEDGVFGFKCFLADSGVEEFPRLESARIRRGIARGRRLRRADGGARRGRTCARALAVRGGPAATTVSSPPGRAEWRTWPSPRRSRPPAGPAAGCTSCTCRPRTRCR